jgi:hypothetical protein
VLLPVKIRSIKKRCPGEGSFLFAGATHRTWACG